MNSNNADQYYTTLKKGYKTELKQLLFSLPDNPLKDPAIMLMENPTPLTVVLSFGGLLVSYSHGADCKVGADLGYAVYQYSKDLKQSGSFPELMTMTILGYAGNYITALNNLSRFSEVIDFVDSEMPLWDSWKSEPVSSQDLQGIHENLKTILVSKIFAFVELKEIDKAEAVINDPDHPVEGNWASDIELNRLKEKINLIRTSPIRTAEQEKDKSGDQSAKQTQQADLYSTLRNLLNNIDLDDLPDDLLTKTRSFDTSTKEGMKQTEDFLSMGEEFLTKNSGEVNEISVRQKIRRASQIFVDNSPEEKEIRDSKNILTRSLEEAKHLKNYELENDARYGLYLCNSRLDKYSEAADHLLEIRKNLEGIRSKINDPYKKAGTFKTYPYLFDASVEYFFKAKRYNDMLDAMEGDKGRIIFDVLNTKTSFDIDEYAGWDISSKLLPLLEKENAHYLSFHLDENNGYFVFLLNSGKIEGNTIPFGKNQLKKWTGGYRLQDPAQWKENIRPIDIIKELNPLVSFLEQYINKGLIKEGDHICYSPDDLLYLFPISYLKIDNKRVIDYFTLSRVHNAMHLKYLLEPKNDFPVNILLLYVPGSEDAEILKQKFTVVPDFLNSLNFNKITYLRKELADYRDLAKNIGNSNLIHFATHGVFSPANPFEESGLLIASDKQLPAGDQLPVGNEFLLSPRKIIELGKGRYLQNAHVSMHACVSGNAKEGLAGDALGLEWAFLQKGASSLSSTYWKVDINAANEYFKLFYTHWLKDGLSKARSHQKALVELKEKEWLKRYPEEYFWAAFELIGDWR